jgi:hypothetical protein
MSAAGLFVVGALVTLTVGVAIALLIYAAILDGRNAREQKAARAQKAAEGRHDAPVPTATTSIPVGDS